MTASAPPRAKSSVMTRWVTRLSWVNLAVLFVISALLFAVSENWWFSSAMTYAPRSPYVVPALLLLVLSVAYSRSAILVNLISIATVAGPIMGLTLPIAQWTATASDDLDGFKLKVLSCNVQDYKPDFASVLAEIGRFNPDVVVMQDAWDRSKLLNSYFAEWHVVRHGEFFLASRYPARLVAVGHFEAFDRDGIIQCELELPSTKVMFFNIHQMTPRHGLRALDISSPITQRGSSQLSRYLVLRAEEAGATRDFVETNRGQAPTLIAGDFNMPCESSLYQNNWFGFQNAFNIAGTGYGYSFPCTQQYCWPGGNPWLRLDHILADDAWQVRSCVVGKANGSDHRLITSVLELR